MSAERPDVGQLVMELTHRDGFTIGHDIEVRVIKMMDHSVRVAINAPKSLEISRFRHLHAPPALVKPRDEPDELEETLRMVRAAQ